MATEFDKLLKLVNEMNKIKGEKCLICHFPDNDSNLVKLNCNHYFHFNCLNPENKLSIICPYCEKITKRNVIKNPKEIRKLQIKEKINNLDTNIVKTCQVILKTGKRKGEKCNRINCRYHKEINVIV